MRLITACFAQVLQRHTSRMFARFLLILYDVRRIDKTCNQLHGKRKRQESECGLIIIAAGRTGLSTVTLRPSPKFFDSACIAPTLFLTRRIPSLTFYQSIRHENTLRDQRCSWTSIFAFSWTSRPDGSRNFIIAGCGGSGSRITICSSSPVCGSRTACR